MLHPDVRPGQSADDFLAWQQAWEHFEADVAAPVMQTSGLDMVLFRLRATTSNAAPWSRRQNRLMRSAVEEAILDVGTIRFGFGFKPAKAYRLDAAGPTLALHVQTTDPRHREVVADVCGDMRSSAFTAASKFSQPAHEYQGPHTSFISTLKARYAVLGGYVSFVRQGRPVTYSADPTFSGAADDLVDDAELMSQHTTAMCWGTLHQGERQMKCSA